MAASVNETEALATFSSFELRTDEYSRQFRNIELPSHLLLTLQQTRKEMEENLREVKKEFNSTRK